MKRISELFNVNTFIVSQVNPHIVPFIQEETASDLTSFSLIKKIQNLLISEFRHWLKQLDYLELIPSFLSKYTKIIMQAYQADVNIVPKIRLIDYYNIFGNIDTSYYSQYRELGAKYTFSSR